MKVILLPTDFSNNSLMAAQFAASQLGNESSKYIFTHIYDVPRGGTSGLFYLLDEIKKQAEKDMKSYVQEVKRVIPEITDNNCEQIIRQGDFEDVCNSVAEEVDANCIVVGTKGSGGLKEVLIGSNTLKLMKSLKRPMYAIPDEYTQYELEELVISYDGKSLNQDVVNTIKEIAELHQLPICFLHVKSDEDDVIQGVDQLNRQFNGFDLNLKESWGDNYEDGLKKGLEGKHALLLLIRHKQSFWESLFNISDSRNAVMHAELPILVVPEK